MVNRFFLRYRSGVKIGLVILHADASRGGAERYTLVIARALAERQHEVALLASSFGDEIDPRVQRVQFHLTGPSKTQRYAQFLQQLDAHRKTHSYDVVHAMLPVRECDVYHPHAGLAIAAVVQGHLKHRGVARLFSRVFNGFNAKRRYFASIEFEMVLSPSAPLVLCLSNRMRSEVRHYYPHVAESQLVTLVNAVDLARFDPQSRPEARAQMRKQLELRDDDVAALIVAQDFERKGLREAILATVQAKADHLRLIVVGRDDARPYEKLAKSLGVSERVRFVGPSSDVYAHYSAADFFVLPTKHDPCSLVVLEALAMGLPVISTKQNGATEVMSDGVDGFIHDDPSDVGALAEAMRKLCDPQTRSKMRIACLERRGRLSFERHMEQLIHIYQQTIDRRTVK